MGKAINKVNAITHTKTLGRSAWNKYLNRTTRGRTSERKREGRDAWLPVLCPVV